jgi:hypothetical protein
MCPRPVFEAIGGRMKLKLYYDPSENTVMVDSRHSGDFTATGIQPQIVSRGIFKKKGKKL